MKKTILAVLAAGLLLAGAPVFAVSPTTSVKSYTTTKEKAKALVEEVGDGVITKQTIVMKPGKKGRVNGIAYTEDILLAEYNPMQYETVTENVNTEPAKPAVAKAKANVKKNKATHKAAVKARHHKAKATANHKVRRHARHYAKKIAPQKMTANQTPKTKTKVVAKHNPNTKVFLEQVQEVYVPNNDVALSESQYVVNGPAVVQLK